MNNEDVIAHRPQKTHPIAPYLLTSQLLPTPASQTLRNEQQDISAWLRAVYVFGNGMWTRALEYLKQVTVLREKDDANEVPEYGYAGAEWVPTYEKEATASAPLSKEPIPPCGKLIAAASSHGR